MASFSPIAVVGRACVLPGALTPSELWEAVVSGTDLLGPCPEGRWRVPKEAVSCDPEGDSIDRTWTDRGGYVRGFEQAWNPQGFGVPAAELHGLDPLFRYTLHAGREALRDADCWRGDTARTLAILGNLGFPSSEMARFAEGAWWGRSEAVDPRNRFMSGLPALLLEEALHLGPGAFALDAACASGLYAIKLGCDALHDGRADRVLAGGVNRADDLFLHVGFAALSALSKTGQSRPFHAEADGLVPAEGCAFVVLRRLEDALAANERILGVIRGVGLSNDGRGRGFLAPSVDGQERALRSAYAQADWDPASVSLVECHATGTTVGDATELASMERVFGEAQDVPIGSLKSNLGHLITVAGVAGLIKVLEALQAKVRPPSLHGDRPLPGLTKGPLRLLDSAEPWTVEGPRRAAVSAFGFGGNNAHLLVEEGSATPTPVQDSPAPASTEGIAIVGVGLRAGSARDRTQVEAALFEGATLDSRASQVTLDLATLRFPPRDLAQTLGQQLLVLAAAEEAVHDGARLDPDRTGALVGMGTDAEVARYGARWRASVAANIRGLTESETQALQDAFVPYLEAPAVLGTMPNIPANRLNQAFGWTGPSFTVSAEEASGLVALELGARALRSGEIDAAVVAAVDLSDEPVHREALAAVRPGESLHGGDAAVVLILKRLSDATADGDPIYAVLDETAKPTHSLGAEDNPLRDTLGRSHAAEALLHVAAAALALRSGQALKAAGWTTPPQAVQVSVLPMAGAPRTTALVPPPAGSPAPQPPTVPTRPFTCEAHPPPVVLPTVAIDAPEVTGPWQSTESTVQTLALPTPLPPVLGPSPTPAMPAPAAPPAPEALPTPPEFPTPPAALPSGLGQAFAQQSALQAHLAQIHQAFLAQQTALHEQFLQVRQQATFTLLDAARNAGALPGGGVPTLPLPAAVPLPAPSAVPQPPPAPHVPVEQPPGPLLRPSSRSNIPLAPRSRNRLLKRPDRLRFPSRPCSPVRSSPGRTSWSTPAVPSAPSSARRSPTRTSGPGRCGCPSLRCSWPTGSWGWTPSPPAWARAPSGPRPTSPGTPGTCTRAVCPQG